MKRTADGGFLDHRISAVICVHPAVSFAFPMSAITRSRVITAILQ
jgi:hypothetical protein